MAGTRVLSEFSYQSGVTPYVYYFTIGVAQTGAVSVRNIQTPFGLILDSMSSLPQSVVTDITLAIAQVENLMAATSAVNGNLTFTNETEKSVLFVTPMASANFRVQTAVDAFVVLRILNKTTTGFTIQSGAPFTGTVDYDVFI